MNIFKTKHLACFILSLIFLIFSCEKEAVSKDQEKKKREHPFLICKQSEFQQLRDRSDNYPWNKLGEDALETASGVWNFREDASNTSNCQSLANYMGACALAYILEPGRKDVYTGKIKRSILQSLDKLMYDEEKKWLGIVPPSNTLFNAILSLDIVYNSLSEEEITRCENKIASKMEHINREGAWTLARYGLYGTWDIYRGKRTSPDNDYYNWLMPQITEDGVTTVASAYAFARLGSTDDRSVKTAYFDVLEYTGIDNRYYDNPKLEKFYSWLFSLGISPFHYRALIGDTGPSWDRMSDHSLFLHALNVNPECGPYLSWYLQDSLPNGNILSYIIPDHPLPKTQKVPSSRVYRDGGGWFRDPVDDPHALMGVLYNIDGDARWHTHKQTNGVYLAGYGNHLTVNSGWLGITEAYLQNTLTINGEDHNTKNGGGLEEGFTTEMLDYACGLDGPALPSSSFKRNLLMVRSDARHNGYFVLVDNVSTNPANAIKSYLHPATESSLQTTKELTQYEATIDHHNRREGVKLSIFYATQPNDIQVDETLSGYLERVPDAGKHKRVEAKYPGEADGNNTLVTVLFPYESEHPKADMSRIDADEYSGAVVSRQSGIQDVILGTKGTGQMQYEDMKFHANIVYAREDQNNMHGYFVRNGKSFINGSMGFSSENPVSMLLHQGTGKVISEGTTVTLFYPGIQSILLDGKEQMHLDKSPGKIKVWIPTGKHTIELVTSSDE
jgi:hypothetical protein